MDRCWNAITQDEKRKLHTEQDKRSYCVLCQCHAMHPDRSQKERKVSLTTKLEPKCYKPGGTRLWQTWRVQSQTITSCIMEAVSMFSSVSERQRVKIKRSWCRVITEGRRAAIISLPRAPLSPWRRESLLTWNQKPQVNPRYINRLNTTIKLTSHHDSFDLVNMQFP